MNIHLILILTTLILLTSCNNTNDNKAKQTDSSIAEKPIVVVEPNSNINGSINGNFGGCGYNYTPSNETITLYEPRQREISQINSILKFSGLASNFKIYSASIDNAIATVIDNKRYILYDPRLLSYTDIKSGSYWSSMSILAHEIGHHLSGHTITSKGSNPRDELEADKYSGFILYKLGATLDDATNAIRTLGSETGSTTHPPKSERIEAITQGWNEANQTRYNGAIPPPPNDNENNFPIYDVRSLIREEYRTAENNEIWYGSYHFLYGIITEVSKDLGEVKVHIVKSSPSFANDFRDIKNEDWTVHLDQTSWSGENEMSHSASMNLPSLMVPGRRIKFAMVEGYPGCGTSANGMWSFIYLEGLNGDSF
ncbi:M48 family metalloprotease [Spirosoma fluviale]|uniref:Peptidase family M48 n=1 Tax=Spirosoma fluviale TaxID=1597977 RepID=A0A286GKR6_9BACT|nr:hypothetical protein [Spirosoma fluviale]SOD96131.1 hypothetical protein SAMN06269250_5153 [Spirosoma fluviale]